MQFEWDESKDGDNQRMNADSTRNFAMRDRYDFSKATPNPYAERMKQQVTIRLDQDTVSYFKAMAEEKGIPYQSLINLYLRDCATSHRKLHLEWIDGR